MPRGPHPKPKSTPPSVPIGRPPRQRETREPSRAVKQDRWVVKHGAEQRAKADARNRPFTGRNVKWGTAYGDLAAAAAANGAINSPNTAPGQANGYGAGGLAPDFAGASGDISAIQAQAMQRLQALLAQHQAAQRQVQGGISSDSAAQLQALREQQAKLNTDLGAQGVSNSPLQQQASLSASALEAEKLRQQTLSSRLLEMTQAQGADRQASLGNTSAALLQQLAAAAASGGGGGGGGGGGKDTSYRDDMNFARQLNIGQDLASGMDWGHEGRAFGRNYLDTYGGFDRSTPRLAGLEQVLRGPKGKGITGSQANRLMRSLPRGSRQAKFLRGYVNEYGKGKGKRRDATTADALRLYQQASAGYQ